MSAMPSSIKGKQSTVLAINISYAKVRRQASRKVHTFRVEFAMSYLLSRKRLPASYIPGALGLGLLRHTQMVFQWVLLMIYIVLILMLHL